MHSELQHNLFITSAEKEKFSYDLIGMDNIRIIDYKNGVFDIALVDQIWSGREKHYARKLGTAERP
ncbi:MAG TPA: hypothetical protein VJG83_06450 [archaeon]|nr:hypothetical protein [archaeon]